MTGVVEERVPRPRGRPAATVPPAAANTSHGRDPHITLASFFDGRYWPTFGPPLSAASRVREGSICKRILAEWGARELDSITVEEVDSWLARVRAMGSPASYNKHRQRLRHLFATTQRWGYRADNPVVHSNRLREPRGRARTIGKEELDAILASAPPDLLRYIVAALQTGQRLSALCNLRVRDVDLRGGTVTFRHTKNGDDVVIPLTTRFRGHLLDWWRMQTPGPDDHVLPRRYSSSVSRAFRKLCERLGSRDLHFHDLRHHVGTTLAMAGANLPAIMAVLGHRDPRMGMRYIHLAGAQSVRAVMDAVL